MTKTKRQVIYEALNVALTGPSKDPRRNGSSEDRLEYLTDAVLKSLEGQKP
ncbi:hypothetical protein LOKG_00008 [Loktanella phage pCB2051-A]|uniref:Uncharacterized protein n=1 Tax=Loktanella phage pCB2051-A TaxID=754044 RepID=M4QP77_9CAUD|nr:hypothetical protein LOKG_00008 [Loktanella phage pCB2051-A]AGH31445.1 hypothetical protein LOKG_00008 [Loktanella phage pCB2051-A]